MEQISFIQNEMRYVLQTPMRQTDRWEAPIILSYFLRTKFHWEYKIWDKLEKESQQKCLYEQQCISLLFLVCPSRQIFA